jgi:hypothetical protein
MPAGPELLGFAYFGAVKLAGYAFAGSVLRRQYQRPEVGALGFGLARTALGVAAGVSVGALFAAAGLHSSEVLFYVLLFPVRMAEWLLVIWLFFERPALSWNRAIPRAALGSMWSYALDLPAILAVFTLPGGSWIC